MKLTAIKNLESLEIIEVENFNLEFLEELPWTSGSHEIVNKVLPQKNFWSRNDEKSPAERGILILPMTQWSHSN